MIEDRDARYSPAREDVFETFLRARCVDMYEHAHTLGQRARNLNFAKMQHRNMAPSHFAGPKRGKGGPQIGRKAKEYRCDVVEIDSVALDDFAKQPFCCAQYFERAVRFD